MDTLNAIRASGLRVIFFDDDRRTTICAGCGCETDLAAANYAGPDLPLWEGATLCNECYARERNDAQSPTEKPAAWKPWTTEKCCVCRGGFSEMSWDNRHTHPHTGGDCHARCCPWCK